jgi:hypothetical protein
MSSQIRVVRFFSGINQVGKASERQLLLMKPRSFTPWTPHLSTSKDAVFEWHAAEGSPPYCPLSGDWHLSQNSSRLRRACACARGSLSPSRTSRTCEPIRSRKDADASGASRQTVSGKAWLIMSISVEHLGLTKEI